MKILIIDTYYDDFLKDFYLKNKVGDLNYEQHKRKLLDGFYAQSDSYSYYLRKVGIEAEELVINDERLQRKWAKEKEIKVEGNKLITKLQLLPLIWRFVGRPAWVQEIALAQIKKYKPDIVYMQNLSYLNPEVLSEINKFSNLIGQIAYVLPPKEYLKKYDLILTSFPHYVSRLRKMGINSEYFKIGFDPRIINKVSKQKKKYNVAFIGAFTPQHSEGTKVLEEIAKKVPVDIWGRGVEFLSPLSPLRKHLHKESACGLYMYKVISQSRIVLNRHVNVAENYANNMRLYETTGMGTMLLTDKKKNLNNLFRVGKEVVDYQNPQEAVEKIRYFLKHETERERLAANGKKRTLKDHSYKARMKELAKILFKYFDVN